MLQVEISASTRTATGKGAMRRLRSEGQTPAVVYGHGQDAQPLQMNTKELTAQLLEIVRRNAVVTLKVNDGVEKSVVLKEVQSDPVTDSLIHADFCEIDLEKDKNFNVPLVYKGTAKGVDLGGALLVHADTVVIKGKPLEIPDEVSLDVTNLNIGEGFTFGDITIADGLTLISNAKKMCVEIEGKK